MLITRQENIFVCLLMALGQTSMYLMQRTLKMASNKIKRSLGHYLMSTNCSFHVLCR